MEREIPAAVAIAPQVSPLTTRWKASQLDTMPGWTGVGIVIPLPEDVVVIVVDNVLVTNIVLPKEEVSVLVLVLVVVPVPPTCRQ